MLPSEDHIIINGTAFKLKAYEITYQDLDDANGTGRDGEGTAFRDYIGTKRTCKAQIVPQTDAGVRTFLQALRGGQFFPVTCRDPAEDTGEYDGTFYCADRNVKALRIYQDGVTLWETSEVELVEQ